MCASNQIHFYCHYYVFIIIIITNIIIIIIEVLGFELRASHRLVIHVYVFMCVQVYIYVWRFVHTEARGQPPVLIFWSCAPFPLRQCLSLAHIFLIQ